MLHPSFLDIKPATPKSRHKDMLLHRQEKSFDLLGPRGLRGGPTCRKTLRSMGHVARSLITLF